jgi:hypothetical protein
MNRNETSVSSNNIFLPDFSGLKGGVVTSKITTPGNDLTILPSTGKYTIIGDAGTTSHSLAANDDLYVTGKLEVDGSIYMDNYLIFSAGGTDIMGYIMSRVDDGIHFCVSSVDNIGNNNFIFTTNTNASQDHDHDTLSADPTIFIHSGTEPDTVNTQWLSIAHNKVDAQIHTGLGNIELHPAAGGYVCINSVKADTGHPGTPVEGMIEINTFDNKVFMYADAAWRQLLTW